MNVVWAQLAQATRRWWGLLIVVVVVLFALWQLAPGSSVENTAEQTAQEESPGNDFLPESGGTSFSGAAPEARQNPAEETRALIADYEEKLAKFPDSPEVPALLMATGNLYKTRLGAYSRATYYYRTLIVEHPDFPQLGQAYVQLCDCYALLGDNRALRLMCREMMRKFPSDSQEYEYARQVLEE